MNRTWLLVVLACASCKHKKEADSSGVPETEVPERKGSGSLAEAGPHADYPTAASAGTDKIFFLEEPDRGPKAPVSYAMPDGLTWTESPNCETYAGGMACANERARVSSPTRYRIGRKKGVTVVQWVHGDRIDDTVVYLTGADGARTQRLHMDAAGLLDNAELFPAPDRFTGRKHDGGNALPGCGLIGFAENDKHQITESRCLQWLADGMRDTSGIAKRSFAYDAKGFLSEEKRFALDGSPANDITGVHRVVYTRDADSRVTLEQQFDSDGKRVVDTSGCAGTRKTWNAEGQLLTTTCVDASDQPIADGDGVTTRAFAWHPDGCRVADHYLDADDKPVADRRGLQGVTYEVDAHCLATVAICRTIAGKAVGCGPDQAAERRFTRNDRGFVTSIRSYHADGTKGVDGEYQVFELRYVVDASGNNTEMACFDDEENAVECSHTGFHAWRTTYDDAGRASLQTFFDTANKPTTNLDVAQRRFRYDNYDHQVEAQNLDADGKPTLSRGTAIRRNLFDATHKLFAILLLDEKGKPAHYKGCYTGSTCPDDEWHAVRIFRRSNGSVEKNEFFDADGQLVMTVDCTKKPCFDND